VICPKCKSSNIKVLESRDTEGGIVVRRRRECDDCKYRFTTFEKIEPVSFIVVKKNDMREPYDRKKLEKGVWVACGKRPVTGEQIDEMITLLEQKWVSEGKKEIESNKIGHDVIEKLKEIDEIAYIRFASVYRNFKDVETFQEELVEFLKKK